jgi:protein-tyrosine-phosphatase
MSYKHSALRQGSALRRIGLAAFCCAALGSAPVFAADAPQSKAKKEHPTIVFTCSHGTIKSLMAAGRFNMVAAMRGIPVRAISRAANVDTVDAEIPEPVAYAMAQDGYYVDETKPKVLTREEAVKALRVVHISLEDLADDPDAKAVAGMAVERWNDIPSGLRDYPTTRKMIDKLVDELVDEYAAKQASAKAK